MMTVPYVSHVHKFHKIIVPGLYTVIDYKADGYTILVYSEERGVIVHSIPARRVLGQMEFVSSAHKVA